MINNEKVRVMTKLAIYEKNEGKEDIKMNHYYKMDYVRYNILKSIVSITVGYFLILLMIIAYNSEYIISNAVTLDYKAIGTYVLGIYIILLMVYVFITIVCYSFKYDASRKRLGGYYKNLKALRKIYRQENSEQSRER